MSNFSPFSLCLDAAGNLYISLEGSTIYCMHNHQEAVQPYVLLTDEQTQDGFLEEATFVSPKGLCWDDELRSSGVSLKELQTVLNTRYKPYEGMWVADNLDHTIRLICEDMAITIAGKSRVQGKADGRARLSLSRAVTTETTPEIDDNYSLDFPGPPDASMPPNSVLEDDSSDCDQFASLDSPLYAVRVPHHPLVVITPTQGLEYRILNLSTWMISTLKIMNPLPPAASLADPWIVPAKDVQHNQTSSAEAEILLLSRTLGTPFRLSIPQRKITSLPLDNSSSSNPTFMVPIASRSAPLKGQINYSSSKWYIEVVFTRRDNKLIARGNFGQQCAFSLKLGLRHSGPAEGALSRWVWPEDTDQTSSFPDEGKKLKRFDVSCLINTVSMPHDLVLQHDASGQTWSLPSDLLKVMHPKMPIDLLTTTVKLTLLPLESVDAFIRYLFMKELPLGPHWRESCRIWHHTCTLLNTSRASVHSFRPFFHRLNSSFLPKLTEEEACLCLLDAWEDRKKIVDHEQIFFEVLSAIVHNFHSTHNLLYYHPPPPSRFEILTAHYKDSEDLEFVSSIKHRAVGYNLRFPLYPGLLAYRPVHWTESSEFPPPPLSYLLKAPNDFVIGFPDGGDQSMSIVCDMFHLYSRWQWFKLKMDAKGLFNEKQRTARLPVGMTQTIASAILEAIHTEHHVNLTEADALLVLERGSEWFLIDSRQEPLQPFVGIWKQALRISFPRITVNNYAHLKELAQRIALKKQIAKLEAFISGPTPSSSS